MGNQTTPPEGEVGAPAPAGLGSPSRRDVLRLVSAWLAWAGLGSCRAPEEAGDERSEIRVVRAEDLLSLRFRFHNLRIVHRRGRSPRLVRIRDGEDALLIVAFPGQHVAEQVFLEQDTPVIPPVVSRLAGPSRLAFMLPPDRDHVDLTLDALLDWRGLVASLPAHPGPGRPPIAPTPEQTAIELPARLTLSPDATGRWLHATRPVTYRGRTELWHTRLTANAPVTAVWSPDLSELGGDQALTSLSANDRRDLVGKTASARTLILSPIGGWLDVEGAWEVSAGASSLEKWRHVTTVGQDQRVVVQRAGGFLYPFGHRAALVKVTERRLHAVDGRTIAYLRQRHFVVVKQAEVEYTHGLMAFRRIIALDRVTPSLHSPEGRRLDELPMFWIETAEDRPFLFRLRAEDWAGRSLVLDAPAIFLAKEGGAQEAGELYGRDEHEERRVRPMASQAAAVVRFDPGDGAVTDRWGEPLDHPRGAGDTTLHLLRVAFAADPAPPEEERAPFTPRTARFEARVPALDPYLDDALNRGWFTLVDPDSEDNLGEVFAEASEGETRIPLYFDERSDRCGGVAAPSFDVAALSRVRGPVGDKTPLYRGGRLDPTTYFHPDRARLLGGVPLADVLSAPAPEEGKAGSPAIPKISLAVACSRSPGEEGKEAKTSCAVSLGLSWSIPLESSPEKAFRFIANRNDAETRLQLAAKLTRRLGGAEREPRPEAGAADGDGSSEKKKGLGVDWTVSGRINDFALGMDARALGSLEIGFRHLALALSTPKTRKTKDGKEEKEGGVAIDFALSHIHTEGPLLFVELLLALVTHLPPLPELPESEESLAYPAALPGVGGADISVTLGPFQAPKQKWGNFEVANAGVSLGVGFFFTGKPPLFSLGLASQDKPLTLMAEPWGGLAHLGVTFSGKELTGFQAALGIVYKLEADLAGSKAKVEGSLTCTFTYLAGDDGRRDRVDVVLRIVGQATIFGFVEVKLALMAAGTWQDGQWFFAAGVTVRVRIGFFAMQASYSFTYRIAGGQSDDRALLGADAGAELDPARLTEDEWRAYTAAFAGA